LDGYVIALDAATGKQDWVVKSAYPEHGETITPAPIIAADKVFIGFGGDEFAARGAVTAYNLADGKMAWKCYNTGSDKDVCLTAKTNAKHPEYGKAGKDLGINTYPGDEWQRGGGAAWAGMPTIPTCTWCTTAPAIRACGPRSIGARSRSRRRTAIAASSTTNGH